MATKSMRYLDHQGRIIIPSHIRKALNLGAGNAVSVELDDDGTIRVRAAKERCSICGNSLEDGLHTEVEVANGKKNICYKCAQATARAMMR